MEKGFVENGFIIDLSNAGSTARLIVELSSIMEMPEVKGKNVCLKLGSLDLKQSQLLSIKALIESMDADIAFIDTTSSQTEASAVSLGVIVSSISGDTDLPEIKGDNSKTVTEESVLVKEETKAEEEEEAAEEEPVSSVEETTETEEVVEDVYDEESTQEILEIIPSEHFETDFETLAVSEGLIPNEEISKYILLDTGDILPENIPESMTDNSELPTLYISQTLRSGQTINYEGNILIVGDAHPGSEIVAQGDITVWGILGGIAHAGSKGNITSKVRALKLNAIQLRIANLYARRNDTLNVPYVQKSNEFTPEEALIEDGKIVIYKKLRRD